MSSPSAPPPPPAPLAPLPGTPTADAVMDRFLAVAAARVAPVARRAVTTFGEVAKSFLQSRHAFLYVAADGRFLGVVSLHDIKPYLDQPDLESLLIARDIMREDFPSLHPEQTMYEALDAFAQTDSERLPVITASGKLLGAVTRTDVLLFLAGKPSALKSVG